MDERREVVDGLSPDEARECLALIGEERVQHDAIHGGPNPTVHSFVSEMARKLADQHSEEQARESLRRQHDAVQNVSDIARELAYRYPDEKVHGQLLVDLDELDEHWRLKHPEEPEPGIEYFRRVVTEVRQNPR